MNIEPDLPPLPRAGLRRAWLDQIEAMQPTHALTLIFNRTVSIDVAQKALRRFFGRIDRDLLGRRFHRAPASRRTDYVAVPEHLDTNSHVHAMLRVLPERHARIEHLLRDDRSWHWNHRLVPGGTHRLVPLHDEGWAVYATKLLNTETQVILAA